MASNNNSSFRATQWDPVLILVTNRPPYLPPLKHPLTLSLQQYYEPDTTAITRMHTFIFIKVDTLYILTCNLTPHLPILVANRMSAGYMVHFHLDHRLYPLPLLRDRHHPRRHPQLSRNPRRYSRGHAPGPSMAPQLSRRVSLRTFAIPLMKFIIAPFSDCPLLHIEIIRVYLLLKIVSRARLVLDYSITLLLYHVLMVTMYSDHVPSTFLWWALNGTTCGIMIFGGEYVCMQQEMEPIILGGSGGSQSNNNNNTSSGNSNNTNSNNTSGGGGGAGSSSGALASQGASLSGMHDGYGNYEESAGLLMETLDHSNNGDLSNHMSLSGSSRTMPTKARSSEDTSGFRGANTGFSPVIRSSILGNQGQGRQRTSDRYESAPTADSDNH